MTGLDCSGARGAATDAGTRLKVLVVDDDPIQRRQLEVTLGRWGYEVRTARDGREALHLMSEEGPVQIVVADWMMPEMDGIELCRRIRGNESHPYVYVILVTSRDRRDDIVTGLDAGADDYLTKPIHHGELQARIAAGKRIVDLQSRLLAAQEQLQIEATHDALTGLWNRRAILENLQREIVRSGRQGTALTVVMADLDHFKHINDTHGHPIGDAALRETALRLGGATRPYDFVGRYGGEEFLIVAPGLEASGASELAERVRNRIAGTPFVTSGPSLSVTLSLGAVSLRGGAEVERVLAAADAALYEAKAAGRNTSRLKEI
ncbi:MAG: diguanylate cyclase [Deltaproteobacteria bacterium]|nr:diguanylate cyclase [Deltaproteobacteria bacterium]